MKNKGTYNYCKSGSPVFFIKADKYFFKVHKLQILVRQLQM